MKEANLRAESKREYWTAHSKSISQLSLSLLGLTRLSARNTMMKSAQLTVLQHRQAFLGTMAVIINKWTNHSDKWGGRKETPNLIRGMSSWITDYLVDVPVYPEKLFRCQFAVPILVFRLITQISDNYDRYTRKRVQLVVKDFGLILDWKCLHVYLYYQQVAATITFMMEREWERKLYGYTSDRSSETFKECVERPSWTELHPIWYQWKLKTSAEEQAL